MTDPPTCCQCGKALGEKAVSDDFCRQECQGAYYAARSTPLVDYREPWFEWAFGARDW